MYLEASTKSSTTIPNSSVELSFEALNRSNLSMELTSLKVLPENRVIAKNINLLPNKKENFKETITITNTMYSSPYWLEKPWDLGMYTVEDQTLIGKPETPRPIEIEYQLKINNEEITFKRPVVHRFSKRDKGEIYEPFEVLPKVTTKLNDKVLILSLIHI